MISSAVTAPLRLAMKSTDAGTSPVKRRRVGAAEEVGFEDALGALLGALEMDGTLEGD